MAPLGPEFPDFSPAEGTPSKARSGNDIVRPRKQQSISDLIQGDVVFEELTTVTSDWVPDDPAAIRFRDDVLKTLKKLVNGTPDYDTGWFYVESGWNWYDINHELGAVPKRTLIYISEVEEPKAGKDAIWEVTADPNIYNPDTVGLFTYGLRLSHAAAGDKSFVLTLGNSIMGWGETDFDTGYLRVLVWR